MKYKFLPIFIVLIILTGCGTLGSFDIINFSVNKEQLALAIDTVYKNYPDYEIPQKWKKFDTWNERGYDFLNSRIFYFKESPEEMYYVTFRGDKTTLPNRPVSIAIRAVSNGKGKWLMQDDFSEKEIERIESRFKLEILSKIKYPYYKSE